jgi:hypothetical protein
LPSSLSIYVRENLEALVGHAAFSAEVSHGNSLPEEKLKFFSKFAPKFDFFLPIKKVKGIFSERSLIFCRASFPYMRS